uniref:G-protein coupled receptors family 1 profile domain-containing protein n=1 Tax=Clytia hemisphaerica TaxID=252671 RepID=A0A7M5UQI3_9CNID
MSRRGNFIIFKEDEIYRLIIALIVLFLNLAEVFFIIYKWTIKKKRKTIYETYLLSLSCADVTFSLANMIFSTMILADSGNLIIATIGYVLSLYLSVSHISAITVDRLIAIIFPLTHKLKVRVKHARMVILTLWFVCIGIGVVLYFEYRNNTFEKYTLISIKFIKLIIYVSDIIFIVAYIILCYILLRQENKALSSTRVNAYRRALHLTRNLIICYVQ